MKSLAKKLDEIESQVTAVNSENSTVVGIVSSDGKLSHTIEQVDGDWIATIKEPEVYLPVKLEAVLKSKKRFIVVIGGRGSAKSTCVGDICAIHAKDKGDKTFCLRQFQASIEDSVHSLLKAEIDRLEFDGFEVTDKKIKYGGREVFKFAGIERTGDSIKSAHGFNRFWIEEAQFITQDSLNILTPTARNKAKKGLPNVVDIEKDNALDGVSMIFVGNPSSSESPFSQRFIVPYESELSKHGVYEDDLHLIVKINYNDNPWFGESGLEQERQFDYTNKTRALYRHVWEGDYNDSIDNALILDEWFDACVDAHLKLGFKPVGARLGSHDPSDGQVDSKGFAYRHGSVVLDVIERTEGNVNEGADWALGLARNLNLDAFTWDCDGMGVALDRQVSKCFDGTQTKPSMFKGSEAADYPDALYIPSDSSTDIPLQNRKKNKEVFKNKRAQYYFELRDRVYRTYRAVVFGDFIDPDLMISFSSEIQNLSKLRAELCRMPIKPNSNGLFELYTKDVMKTKFKVASPNLADSVMMLMRNVVRVKRAVNTPRQIKQYGAGA